MPKQLPDRIRLDALARSGSPLEGVWERRRLQRVPRCAEIRAAGDLAVHLTVQAEPGGVFLVRGRIAAELELVCQRCLLGYPFRLEADIRLASGPVPQALADEYEPLDGTGEELDLRQLLEDELILQLPEFPMHPRSGDCDPQMLKKSREFDGQTQPDTREDNPFAVLKQLDKRRS